MNAQQALSKAMRQAKLLRNDETFLRIYVAAINGVSAQYERRKAGDWPQETSFADPERCDLLAERALVIASCGWELLQGREAACELFNSTVMQAKPNRPPRHHERRRAF